MTKSVSRRAFLAAATVGAVGARSLYGQAGALPTSPVAIARCRRYDFATVKASLATMFDQLGGIGGLVRGKTVSVKINVTGGWHVPVYTLSPVETVYTHPIVVLAACSLFYEAGASRIIICESLYSTDEVRASYSASGYDLNVFASTVPVLEWENTRNRGTGGEYRELPVGADAYLYQSIQVNHRYVDTDVMVSIPKMKNHDIAGVTLAMKNLFGTTPSALYSSAVHREDSTQNRAAVLHQGGMSAAGGEVLPVPSFDPGFRVPRAVVDIVRARPIDLSIVDAVVSMHGGEGAWNGTQTGIVTPGLLIAGRNPVCTDTVCTAVMGYDPSAARGTRPFYNADNTLALAAARGVGTNRLSDIEVRGLSIDAARYNFLPGARH